MGTYLESLAVVLQAASSAHVSGASNSSGAGGAEIQRKPTETYKGHSRSIQAGNLADWKISFDRNQI